MALFDFMATDNAQNVPKCNQKDGGLIKIFLAKIPFGYGTRKMSEFSDRRFTELDDFISAFAKAVERDYSQSLKAVAVNNNFDSQKPNIVINRSHPIPVKRVYNIEHLDEEEVIEKELDHDERSETSVLVEEAYRETVVEPVVDADDEQDLNAFSGNPKTPASAPITKTDGSHACFGQLFEGKCNRPGKCTFSHEFAALKKAYHYYADKVDKMKTKYGEHEPSAILRRQPPGAK
jgi:hypothetical protein